jgi:TRAP-type C4-dicarboxylate transport system permease large subunit
MAQRRFNLQNVLVELGFAATALALGALGAPYAALLLLIAVMIAYWLWSRRRALDTLRREQPRTLIVQTLLALAMLAIVLGGAFLAGSSLNGVFRS